MPGTCKKRLVRHSRKHEDVVDVDQCFLNFLHCVPPLKILGLQSTAIMSDVKMQKYRLTPFSCRQFTQEAGLLLIGRLFIVVESLMKLLQELKLICLKAVLLICTSIPDFSHSEQQLQSF